MKCQILFSRKNKKKVSPICCLLNLPMASVEESLVIVEYMVHGKGPCQTMWICSFI